MVNRNATQLVDKAKLNEPYNFSDFFYNLFKKVKLSTHVLNQF